MGYHWRVPPKVRKVLSESQFKIAIHCVAIPLDKVKGPVDVWCKVFLFHWNPITMALYTISKWDDITPITKVI